MNPRKVELEMVQYRTADIGHATDRLIRNYAEYSGIEGTKQWPRMWHQVMLLIRDQIPFNCLWEARGVDISFSFFLEPQPRMINGGLIYSPPEPRIAFTERPEFVRPSVRTHIGRVIEAIAREMHEVYHLAVKKDPVALVFSNNEYARRIDRFSVPLLVA